MDRLHNYVTEHRQSILDLLVSLVNENSYTGNPAGVNRVGDTVSAFLRELGFEEKRFERKTVGDHRRFTRAGTGKKVIFSCHLDTVFPPDLGFNTCTLGDEVTTGPGVIDMKGGVTVLLQALKMLDAIGEHPKSDYTIFFSTDEETGSEDARELIEAEAPGKDYGLVFECGGAQGEIVSTRKGVGTFKIDIQGKAAHAGNDYASGVNANLEAAHKLIEIQSLTRLEVGTTVNVGLISGGIGANTISPSAQLVIDFRNKQPDEAERIVAELQKAADRCHVQGTVSKLSGRVQRPVMQETEATRAFIKLIGEVCPEVKTEKRGGVGDANFLAALGVPTLDGFGPCGGKDHTKEEFMITRTLFERIELLGRVLQRIDA